MIVVPHFCAKDWQATVKNLRWWIELDGRSDLACILSHDDETPKQAVAEVEALARQFFASVETYWYPAPQKKTWPAAPNFAWQSTARYMAHIKRGPWLWLESDAIAIRKGWLRDIAAEHYRVGKPFSGHFVDGMAHLNGVAVYPPVVAEYSTQAFLNEESAWDVVLGSDLSLREGGFMTYCHPAHTLFQHCWCINKDTGKAWNGAGDLATFRDTRDVVRLVDLTMALFHRNKDGTLIDMLRKHYAHPELAMVPQHTEPVYTLTNPSEKLKPFNPADYQGEWTAEHETEDPARKSSGVPEAIPGRSKDESDNPAALLTTEAASTVGGATQASQTGLTKHDEKPNEVLIQAPTEAVPTAAIEGRWVDIGNTVISQSDDLVRFTGQCEILIVTYGLPTLRPSGQVISDFDWLRWCLRCIRKHCTGFRGITVAIPNRDADLLKPIANEHAQSKCGIPFRVQMYTEREGKGMLGHMAMMAGADQLVPKDTTHVLHVDADVMFKEPVTPSDYFNGDKPVYVVRSWDSLYDKERNATSDCLQWREPTDKQLGFASEIYSMCRHPSGFPIGLYPEYRDCVEKAQGRPFVQWMLEGKNAHPQNRMDFTAMGAYAYAKMRDKFHWIDISAGNHLAPRDKQKCYWSHGGLSPAIQQEIEGFLA